MLRQLSIHSRSAGELRQLAVERREQAATKSGSIRALLLKEAQLLEFQVELRNWADRANIETRADGRQAFRPASWPSVPYELAPLVAKMSSRLGLAATDQQALLAAATRPRFVHKGQVPM